MRGLRLSEEGLWCCSLQLSKPWFSYSSSDICHVTVVSSCIHCLVQLVIVTLGLWSVIPTVIRLDGSGLSIIMAECGCLSGGIASGPQPTSCCQYCSRRGQVNLLNACTCSSQWPLCYPIDLFKVTVWFWAVSLILFCWPPCMGSSKWECNDVPHLHVHMLAKLTMYNPCTCTCSYMYYACQVSFVYIYTNDTWHA